MIETLRQKSRKSHIIKAAVSLVIVIALLVWTKFAIFQVIVGPTPLDITADPTSYEGKYVTIDAEYFLWDYVEHTTTTTRKSGSKTTTVNGDSYIVFQSLYDDSTNYSTWYFYSVYLKKSERDVMSDKMDEAWAYWQDTTGTIAPPEPITVSGTWTRMESKMEQYYRESLEDMGIEATEYDIIYYYTLDTSKIGGQHVSAFWTQMAVALLALLFGIYNVIGALSNGYLKNINKYLHNNTTVSLSAIEADFASAHAVGSKVWVGNKWTIYMKGAKAMILTNANLVWGYYYRRTGKHSVSEMRLFDINKKLFHIELSESQTQEALRYYSEEQPQMVLGYTKELEKSYQKDFTGFLNLRYNPAKSAQTGADPYANL